MPIDVGFSPNDQQAVVMTGYPLVELLAALGMEHARPTRVSALEYRYELLGTADSEADLIPVALHRLALGGSGLPFPKRHFAMHLGWPGQEGQARCILQVVEEDQT